MKLEDIKWQTRDYKPTTSPGVLQEFLNGSIHLDFLNELAIRIEDMRDFYEECDSKNYLETRGGIKALRLVADIFHNLYSNAIMDGENKEKLNG